MPRLSLLVGDREQTPESITSNIIIPHLWFYVAPQVNAAAALLLIIKWQLNLWWYFPNHSQVSGWIVFIALSCLVDSSDILVANPVCLHTITALCALRGMCQNSSNNKRNIIIMIIKFKHLSPDCTSEHTEGFNLIQSIKLNPSIKIEGSDYLHLQAR